HMKKTGNTGKHRTNRSEAVDLNLTHQIGGNRCNSELYIKLPFLFLNQRATSSIPPPQPQPCHLCRASKVLARHALNNAARKKTVKTEATFRPRLIHRGGAVLTRSPYSRSNARSEMMKRKTATPNRPTRLMLCTPPLQGTYQRT